MSRATLALLSTIVTDGESAILSDWITRLREAGTLQTGRISEAELQTQARGLLDHLKRTLAAGGDLAGEPAQSLRDYIDDVSRSRAVQGFSPRETALFVFSLKQSLFATFQRRNLSAEQLAELTIQATQVLDEIGLLTMEAFQKSREAVIVRQQRELSELSTPVVKLWEGILALPLIGTLDSERTQVVMENLLQSIVASEADIAIIDITGVPTVDTLTAQHLLKTIAAARLMGADCIISGIRPQIAQTMVHLGVELNVISKATLADAFALALKRVNRAIVAVRPSGDRTAS